MKNKIIFTLLICTFVAIVIVMLLPEKIEKFSTEVIKKLPLRKELFTLLTSTNKTSFIRDKKLWKDLSGKNNNFNWNSIPPLKNNSLYITKQVATLNSTNKLNKKQFTIMVKCKTTGDKGKTSSIIELPGNDNIGLSLSLDNNYGNIYLTVADEKLSIDKKIRTDDMTWFTIVYKEDDKTQTNMLSLYVNRNEFYSKEIDKKIYFNDPTNIIVNKEGSDSSGPFELQTIAIYNDVLTSGDISLSIKKLNSRNKIETESKPGVTSPFDDFDLDISIVDETSDFGISSNKCIKLCREDCNKARNHKECYQSCAKRIPECKTFCDENPKNEFCKEQCADYGKCPDVELIKGEYICYVYKNTPFAKRIGRSGTFNYGRDRNIAETIYSRNFPSCRLPDIFKNNPNNDKCPFLVTDGNPCKSRECVNVNWKKWSKDPLKVKMGKKCKKNVAHYCSINKTLDPNCYCWKDNYQDDKFCSMFRRHFDDQNCRPSQFDIKEHPDFDKYIKKDNIPCWGCNLTDSDTPDTIGKKKYASVK